MAIAGDGRLSGWARMSLFLLWAICASAIVAPVIASALEQSSYYSVTTPPIASSLVHVETLRGRIPAELFVEVHRDIAQSRLDFLAPVLCGLMSTLVVWTQHRAALPLVGRQHASLVVRWFGMGTVVALLPAALMNVLGTRDLVISPLLAFGAREQGTVAITSVFAGTSSVIILSLSTVDVLGPSLVELRSQAASDACRRWVARVCGIRLPLLGIPTMLRYVQLALTGLVETCLASAILLGTSRTATIAPMIWFWVGTTLGMVLMTVVVVDAWLSFRNPEPKPDQPSVSQTSASKAKASASKAKASASKARARSSPSEDAPSSILINSPTVRSGPQLIVAASSTQSGDGVPGKAVAEANATAPAQTRPSRTDERGRLAEQRLAGAQRLSVCWDGTPETALFLALQSASFLGVVAPQAIMILSELSTQPEVLARPTNGTSGLAEAIEWPAGCVSDQCLRGLVTTAQFNVHLTWIGAVCGVINAVATVLFSQALIALGRRRSARDAAKHMHSALLYISHEARSPLNGAVLSLTLLDGIINSASPGAGWEEAPGLVGDLHASVEAAKRQLDDILTFERVTSTSAAKAVPWGWCRVAGSELRRLRSSFAGVCRAERIQLQFVGVAQDFTELAAAGWSSTAALSITGGQTSLGRSGAIAQLNGASAPVSSPRHAGPATVAAPSLDRSSAGLPAIRPTMPPRAAVRRRHGGAAVPGGVPLRTQPAPVSRLQLPGLARVAPAPLPSGAVPEPSEGDLCRDPSVAVGEKLAPKSRMTDGVHGSRSPQLGEPVVGWEIFTDVDRIMTIIGNALSNSVKFVPGAGRGTVTVSLGLGPASLLPGRAPSRRPVGTEVISKQWCTCRDRSYNQRHACERPAMIVPEPSMNSMTQVPARESHVAPESQGSQSTLSDSDPEPATVDDARAGPGSSSGPARLAEHHSRQRSNGRIRGSDDCRHPERRVLVVEVLDNGCGIAPDRLRSDELFRPFQQLRMGDGMLSMAAGGLGLSTVRAIVVDQMGGDVGLSSREGEGTLFTARVPVWARRSMELCALGGTVRRESDSRQAGLPGVEAAAVLERAQRPLLHQRTGLTLDDTVAAGAAGLGRRDLTESHQHSHDLVSSSSERPAVKAAVSDGGQLRAPPVVWVVDDVAVARRSVARALRAWGLDVREIEDGRDMVDAVEALLRHAPGDDTRSSPPAGWPCAIVLDSRMPRLGGAAALREARGLVSSSGCGWGLVAIGATGSGPGSSEASELESSGASCVLGKPILPGELAGALVRSVQGVALPPRVLRVAGIR